MLSSASIRVGGDLRPDPEVWLTRTSRAAKLSRQRSSPFADHHSVITKPFEWRVSRLDLRRVLAALPPVVGAAETIRCMIRESPHQAGGGSNYRPLTATDLVQVRRQLRRSDLGLHSSRDGADVPRRGDHGCGSPRPEQVHWVDRDECTDGHAQDDANDGRGYGDEAHVVEAPAQGKEPEDRGRGSSDHGGSVGPSITARPPAACTDPRTR